MAEENVSNEIDLVFDHPLFKPAHKRMRGDDEKEDLHASPLKRPRRNDVENVKAIEKKSRKNKENCDCVHCSHVTRIASETRELPTFAIYRILHTCVPCPHVASAYRRGIRDAVAPKLLAPEVANRLEQDSCGDEDTEDPMCDKEDNDFLANTFGFTSSPLTTDIPYEPPFLPLDSNVNFENLPMTPPFDAPMEYEPVVPPTQVSNEMSVPEVSNETEPLVVLTNSVGGKYPAPRVYLPPFEPRYDNVHAWVHGDRNDLFHRVRARFTPHARVTFAHPRVARVKTDFSSTRHDYYLDGRIRKPTDLWKSVTAFGPLLFKKFDRDARSIEKAQTCLGITLLRNKLGVLLQSKEKYFPKLWGEYSRNQLQQKGVPLEKAIARLTGEYLELFIHLKRVDNIEGCSAEPYTGTVEEIYHEIVQDAKLRRSNDDEFLRDKLIWLLAKEYIALWEFQRDSGTDKHDLYDRFIQHKPMTQEEIDAIPLGFLRAMAYISDKYDAIATEMSIFDEECRVISQADLILIDRVTGEIITADFKNCKYLDLTKTPGNRSYGTHPLSVHMNGCHLNKYNWQVSHYRDILDRFYYPGQMSWKILILNFCPSEPDGFQQYWIDEAIEMSGLRALLPWRDNDPRHLQFVYPAPGQLIPPFPDDDPRIASGSTKKGERPANGSITVLPPEYVWTCAAYNKYSYQLPEYPYKHQWYWFGPPPFHAAWVYEMRLLSSPEILSEIPRLVGKTLLCWCRDDTHKCHAEVLRKYANLYEGGAWSLDQVNQKAIIGPDARGMLSVQK